MHRPIISVPWSPQRYYQKHHCCIVAMWPARGLSCHSYAPFQLVKDASEKRSRNCVPVSGVSAARAALFRFTVSVVVLWMYDDDMLLTSLFAWKSEAWRNGDVPNCAACTTRQGQTMCTQPLLRHVTVHAVGDSRQNDAWLCRGVFKHAAQCTSVHAPCRRAAVQDQDRRWTSTACSAGRHRTCCSVSAPAAR